MTKEKIINIMSCAIVVGFNIYVCLSDKLSSMSIILIMLSPLYYGLVHGILTSLISPEKIQPEYDRLGDSDGEF